MTGQDETKEKGKRMCEGKMKMRKREKRVYIWKELQESVLGREKQIRGRGESIEERRLERRYSGKMETC